MRILAIRGCNLASLAGEFEIDLSRAPFCDAGVFAIVGNTGAGKSTLLDALCVALFDRTPRLTNHSRVVVGRGDDDPCALGAQDVRTLLRRGAAAGWAEVDFESGDARRYRARWSVRRARGQTDGTLQDQQLTLTAIDGGERFGGTKTETLKAIVARLGLTFDQFRRSALLAQGEFAAFLRADGKDRSELLERMTGTEIYSRLSVAAHLRASLAEQRLRDGRARADAIPVLADDARATTHAALAVADHAKVAARARLAEAEAIARWREEHRRLRTALAEANREHASARSAVAAADADRAELALRRRAEQLRAVWEDAARIDRALAIARAEVSAADAALHGARATHEAILGRRSALASLHGPVRAARIAAGLVERTAPPSGVNAQNAEELLAIATPDAAWLSARAALGPEVAAWAELDTRFAQHGALVDAIASIDRTVRDHTSTRSKLAKARAAVALDHAAAAHKLADAQRKATSFHQRRGLTLDAARRQEDEARTRVAEVERLVSIATTAREAIGVRDQIDQQLADLEEHASHDAHHHARLTTDRTLAAAIRTERARVVDDLRRAAGYEHARAELEDDEPCPLCGATDHPWKERGAFDDVIRVEEARLAEVTATVESTTTALAALAARAHQRDKDRQRLARSRETAVSSAASDVSRWRDQLASLGELLLEGDPSTPDAARIAADLEATARARLEQARMVFSQTQAATKAAQEAQADMQLAQASVDQIHEHLADHDRRIAELDATLQRLAGERASRTERRLELESDLAAAIARWRAASSTVPSSSLPSSTSSAGAAATAEPSVKASSKRKRAADSEIPIPANLVDARGAMSELAAAWRSRADRVAVADASALAALASIERAEQDAARSVAEHAAIHESSARRRESLVVELREAAARLDAARIASGFDVDALRRLLAADASRADELAASLASLDRTVERTRAVVVERRARFEAHALDTPARTPTLELGTPALDAAAASGAPAHTLDTPAHALDTPARTPTLELGIPALDAAAAAASAAPAPTLDPPALALDTP
ncbi:MAG: AAA family ATPase, partial [Myxococcota bacterium]|nr:AAA family ATPase [Myxococcota bacterium]